MLAALKEEEARSQSKGSGYREMLLAASRGGGKRDPADGMGPSNPFASLRAASSGAGAGAARFSSSLGVQT